MFADNEKLYKHRFLGIKKESRMKKLLAAAFCLIVFCVASSPAFAGGGKVRGDKGQGTVAQIDANSQGNQN